MDVRSRSHSSSQTIVKHKLLVDDRKQTVKTPMMEPYNLMTVELVPNAPCRSDRVPPPTGAAVSRLLRLGVVFLANVATLGLLVPSRSLAQGTILPNGWISQDIGSPGVPGSTTVTNGIWTVSGSGLHIYGAS